MSEHGDDVGDSSAAFEVLLREAARQSYVSGRPVLTAGQRLDGGRFEILRRIGQGGMGVVYEAYDCARRERVALKTMTQLEAGDVYRFKNEFRALAGVSHPNLVRLHELCADGQLWCFTMELVEGQHFDRWVRPRIGAGDQLGALDESRLRDALPQLVEAVATIHAAGKLHRDLKPSNVLVTAAGRVVVLDLGLAIEPNAGGVGQTVTGDVTSGTPAYMAPEQAAGQAASPASDFYAIGAMVFEALTGRLPFSGSAQEILVDKQRAAAPRASAFAPGLPPELDRLCAQLLAREPSARPDACALRSLFPRSTERSRSSSAQGSRAQHGSGERASSHQPDAAPELLGRAGELAAMREAFDATLRDHAVVLLVSGESGIGKSALCEAFLRELRSQGRANVLAGRCYERENVPFRGLDSLVDDLSRHLRRLPRDEAAAVLPRDVHALARLFPVLDRVEVVASAPKKNVADPLELRRRACAALLELLARMRDRAPLCVYLDDLQWLDADAVLFMRAMMVHAEPAPLLIVLSHRSEDAENNPALLRVRDAIGGNSRMQLRTLALGPLAQQPARDLALRLLPDDAAEASAAAGTIARESGGSPFLVGELCRFAEVQRDGACALGQPSLQAALDCHLSALSPGARRLLEHAALAGKPLPAGLLSQATGATHAELDRLRTSRLLRVCRLEGGASIDCYHDKVREMVAAALSEPQRVRCFAALARALDASAYPDPELLATCLEGAGQPAAAAEQCVRAADRALAGTAFLRAAELYAKARALGRFAPEREHALHVAQADALAHAGRGKQAAEVFLRAAQDVLGSDNRELRRRAATELFNTGHAEEGLLLFRQLFAELAVPLPPSPGAAVRRLMLSQLRVRLRGLDYTPREAGLCAPPRLESLALQGSALEGLSLHAPPVVAACVADDYLLHALSEGVPEHVAKASAFGAYFLSFARPSAAERIGRLNAIALGIAAERSDAALLGTIERVVGATAMNRGLWAQGRTHLARALEILRGDIRGANWEIDSAEFYDQMAAYFRGDWLDVASVTPSAIEQGYSRDRIWIGIMLSAQCAAVAWLCRDDAVGYCKVLERARACWHPGKDAQWPDFVVTFGAVMFELYRGEAVQAHAAMEQQWAWLSRSIVARAQLASTASLHLRGMAALAALRETGTSASLSVVKHCEKGLGRVELPFAVPYRDVLRAGRALHARDLDLGAEHLRAAVAGFEHNDMRMAAAAARRRLGELLGGDEGKALLADGDAAMRARSVANLDAITEMLCAGCRAP